MRFSAFRPSGLAAASGACASRRTRRDEKARIQLAGWTEVARYLRGIDPYHNLLAVHPAWNLTGRQSLTDESLSDFDMLQTGHSGYYSLVNSVEAVQAAARRSPRMPVLNRLGAGRAGRANPAQAALVAARTRGSVREAVCRPRGWRADRRLRSLPLLSARPCGQPLPAANRGRRALSRQLRQPTRRHDHSRR